LALVHRDLIITLATLTLGIRLGPMPESRLYKIARCNPLRSKLVCLIQKSPIPDHAVIE
jgi:hypothetical protein